MRISDWSSECALPISTPEPANAANIDVADWQVDPNRWSLSFAQGPRVQLSMTEMLILQYLIGAAGQVASRDQLLRMLGHHGIRVYSRNLDAMISRLRKKTERVTGQRLAVRSEERRVGKEGGRTCRSRGSP